MVIVRYELMRIAAESATSDNPQSAESSGMEADEPLLDDLDDGEGPIIRPIGDDRRRKKPEPYYPHLLLWAWAGVLGALALTPFMFFISDGPSDKTGFAGFHAVKTGHQVCSIIGKGAGVFEQQEQSGASWRRKTGSSNTSFTRAVIITVCTYAVCGPITVFCNVFSVSIYISSGEQ